MLKDTDPEIFNLIKKEKERQQQVIELIPSENFTSLAVLSNGLCPDKQIL